MTIKMPASDGQTVHTRASLLQGIQCGDEDRWHEFHCLYGPIIRAFALKAGLNETEADEVLQETCIGLAKNVGEFHYDPAKCRFKTWLLNLASWRVKNQFAKRQCWDARLQHSVRPDSDQTATIERAADPATFEKFWDKEWNDHVMKSAVEKIRSEFSASQFQMFDLNVLKEWPARDVAKSLGVSTASVYLAKHRISAALKKEITRRENQL
jgi:RNA polymerase sigma factor (sigma-70 family)